MKKNVKRIGNGVLYIASSKNFIKAAINSALTVKTYSPELNIHIFMDEKQTEIVKKYGDIFSSFGIINNPHYRSKVDYLTHTPFKRTLYLDSDTKICDSIYDIFELLERFDIALAHAHKRNSPKTTVSWTQDIPLSFPQYNGGVIAYNSSQEVIDFLDSWKSSFHHASFEKDQVTLRELLWFSKLRIATLPPEYNIRYSKYLKVWSKQEAIPKILHLEKYVEKEKMRFSLKSIIKTFGKLVSIKD